MESFPRCKKALLESSLQDDGKAWGVEAGWTCLTGLVAGDPFKTRRSAAELLHYAICEICR